MKVKKIIHNPFTQTEIHPSLSPGLLKQPFKSDPLCSSLATLQSSCRARESYFQNTDLKTIQRLPIALSVQTTQQGWLCLCLRLPIPLSPYHVTLVPNGISFNSLNELHLLLLSLVFFTSC